MKLTSVVYKISSVPASTAQCARHGKSSPSVANPRDLCIQCEGVSASSGGHTPDHIMMKVSSLLPALIRFPFLSRLRRSKQSLVALVSGG